jgi:membrane associated rhomboid family serine protease
VLGGYLLLFPYRRVTVIIIRFLTQVPAYVAIGMRFVLQLIQSIGVFGGTEGTSVAYAAHIGGFVLGVAIIKPFALGRVYGQERAGLYDPPPNYPADDYPRGPWQ